MRGIRLIKPILSVGLTLLLLVLPFSAAAKTLKIVTDIAPVQLILAAVTKGVATPKQLVRPGVSLHDFALKPSDIRSLQAADLIFWIGPGAVPGLVKILADDQFMAKTVQMNVISGTLRLPLRRSGVFAAASTTMTETIDPHTWLAPANVILWATKIAEVLAAQDPENRQLYLNNSKILVSDILKLSNQINAQFKQLRQVRFVQYHDAFQYFEHSFDLYPLGFVTVGDEEAASLGTISDLREALVVHPSSCVFVTNEATKDRARPLVENTNASIGTVHPTGEWVDPPPITYTALLQTIADGFATCLADQS